MDNENQNNKVPAGSVAQGDAGGLLVKNTAHDIPVKPTQDTTPNTSSKPDKVVETYAEDMARVIEGSQGGLIKKIIQEQTKKEEEKRSSSPESRKNKLYMILGAVLLFFALVTFVFFLLKEDIYVVPVEQQFSSLVFNDKSFFIEIGDLSKDKIVASILTETKETKLKDGGLEGIYLTSNKQVIGLRQFINVFKSSFIPPDRALVSDSFLLGLVNTETKPDSLSGKDLFILIKTRTFVDIFDSMKAWENKILNDLHALFEIPINSSTSYLFTKNFEDGIVENKNARILYDQDGGIALMYVFANDTSLIIASKRDVVREVMFRLSSSQIKK